MEDFTKVLRRYHALRREYLAQGKSLREAETRAYVLAVREAIKAPNVHSGTKPAKIKLSTTATRAVIEWDGARLEVSSMAAHVLARRLLDMADRIDGIGSAFKPQEIDPVDWT